MKHEMNLHDEPFKLIQNGSKTIEMRLNDEKRQLLNIDDTIEFTNRVTLEKIETKIINLYYYDSFKELYKNFDKVSIGYKDDEEAKPEDMEMYYSKEDIEKYGVVAIEIRRV